MLTGPFIPLHEGGKEVKKKKSSTAGKKPQENNASEDEAEEKWLMAIEAGKLEEVPLLSTITDTDIN